MSTLAFTTGSVKNDTRIKSDCRIVITREFDAPRALVFKAWTDPKQVMHWWGPKGCTNTLCEMDLRVGGVFRVHMHAPDGVMYPCTGIYREIVEPEKIVYLGVADDGHPCGAGLPPRAIVTITFDEHGAKTRLTINTQLESMADYDAVVQVGFNAGWTTSLERFDEYLAEHRS